MTKFNQIIKGECNDVCGCSDLVSSLKEDFYDDREQCECTWCGPTPLPTLSTTNDASNNTSGGDQHPDGSSWITGTILGIIMVIMAIGIIWYLCYYKKRDGTNRVHVRQDSHAIDENGNTIEMDEIETNNKGDTRNTNDSNDTNDVDQDQGEDDEDDDDDDDDEVALTPTMR